MRIFSGEKDIQSRDQAQASEILTSFVSKMKKLTSRHTRCGFRLKLERKSIFSVVDEDGCDQPYRLTITLDWLAGSKKTESGMTTTEKPGESTNEITRTRKKEEA